MIDIADAQIDDKRVWRKNRKESWKGRYHTGHLCVSCIFGFYFRLSLPKIGYYEKLRDGKYHPIICRMCDDCLKYAIKEKMIVDYKLV